MKEGLMYDRFCADHHEKDENGNTIPHDDEDNYDEDKDPYSG